MAEFRYKFGSQPNTVSLPFVTYNSNRSDNRNVFSPRGIEFISLGSCQRRRVRSGLVFQAVIIDVAIELLAHGGAPSVEPGFDDIEAQIQYLRRLLRAQFLQVPEKHYGAV